MKITIEMNTMKDSTTKVNNVIGLLGDTLMSNGYQNINITTDSDSVVEPETTFHIDRSRVHDIYANCLFSAKNSVHYIKVVGIKTSVLFDADAIEEYEEEIHNLLNSLPEGFAEDSEDKGKNIIQATKTRSGQNWGDWSDAQILCLLGVASGWARIIQSTSISFPYIVITSDRKDVKFGNKEELDIINKTEVDSMRISDLYRMQLPTQVVVDIHKRISDWLLSGGDESDPYVQQQLQYARKVHTCVDHE